MNGQIIVIILLSINCAILAYKGIRSAYKIGYYEQTLRNRKHLFDTERWSHIDKVMKGKFNIFE